MAFPGHAGRAWPLTRWRSLARISESVHHASGRRAGQVPRHGDGSRGMRSGRPRLLGARPRRRRAAVVRRGRGPTRRARWRQPVDDRHRAARPAGRGGVAPGSPHGRDRDGQGERARPRRRGGRQRSARRHDRRHRRTDRQGGRPGRPPGHRRPRRVGDDGRRARSGRGASQPSAAAHGRVGGGVRRAHPVRRRGGRVRPAEGRQPGTGRATAGPARAARRALPRPVRRRRESARRRRRSWRPRRRARRARWPAGQRVRARRRARRPG